MGTKPRKPVTPPELSSTPNEPELPERWSVQRKSELVLRLLRGDALDAVSRESQVPAHELESWKRIFLEQGTRGLKTRSDRGGTRTHAGPRQDRRADPRAALDGVPGDGAPGVATKSGPKTSDSDAEVVAGSTRCSQRLRSTAKATVMCGRAWRIEDSPPAASAS